MFEHEERKFIEDIIKGNVIEGEKDYLTTIRNYLLTCFGTNNEIETKYNYQSTNKEKQKLVLIDYLDNNNLWIDDELIENNYLVEGGEAKIYFGKDARSVIKLNDAIYYSTWLDYFNSVLLHNCFFPNTFYELVGFKLIKDELYAVLKQPFIISTEIVDLQNIKIFLEYNGFLNTKRTDYFNQEYGLILEDIHDENVIVNNDVLFFIDTVFYIHSSKI
jgi:hypothetical protein